MMFFWLLRQFFLTCVQLFVKTLLAEPEQGLECVLL